MDEVATLIESYYRVAANLREHGERMMQTAEMLATTADRMSEERARRQPQPDSANEGQS